MPPWIDIRAPLVNPLGNPLSQYSSATWINLGQPGVLVDFTALGTGTPLAAGTLPGGGTYTQAAGANQTQEAVQTSASTVSLWTFVANLPRIGYAPDGGTGLVLEPPRTNELTQARQLNTWNAGTATLTANAAAGPDGSVLADRVAAASGQYGPFQSPTGLTSSQPYVFSQWVRRGVVGAGSTHGFWEQDGTTSAIISTEVGALSDSWQRVANAAQTLGASTTSVTAISCEGRTIGGLVAQARDVMIDFSQVEKGSFPTSPLPSVAAKMSRAGFGASWPIGQLLRGGVFRFRQQFVPLGAATAYAADGSALRLWTCDANNYAEIATATRVLTVVVNGVSRVAGTALTWTSGLRLEFVWEVGNGNLRVRYRTSSDRGASWSAAVDPYGGIITDSAISTSATTLLVGCDTGATKCFGHVLTVLEGLNSVPAWAA